MLNIEHKAQGNLMEWAKHCIHLKVILHRLQDSDFLTWISEIQTFTSYFAFNHQVFSVSKFNLSMRSNMAYVVDVVTLVSLDHDVLEFRNVPAIKIKWLLERLI